MAAAVLAIKKFFESQHILLSIPWIESFLEWCKQEDNLPLNYTEKDLHENVYEQWLLQDLRDIETAALPVNLTCQEYYTINGVFCLQLIKVVDISKPKVWQLQKIRNTLHENTERDSNFSNRMLQLTLTDGVQEVEAMELQHIASLSIDLTPGTKIKLLGPVKVRRGRIMLESKHVKVLGGEVEELKVLNLVENVLARALNKMAQNQIPTNVSSDIFPKEPFVPANVNQKAHRRNSSPVLQIINPPWVPATSENTDQLSKTRAPSFSNPSFPEDYFIIDDEMLLEAEKQFEESKNLSANLKTPNALQNFEPDDSLYNEVKFPQLDGNTSKPKHKSEKDNTVIQSFDLKTPMLEDLRLSGANKRSFKATHTNTTDSAIFQTNIESATLKPRQVLTEDLNLNDSILEKFEFPDIHILPPVVSKLQYNTFFQCDKGKPCVEKPSPDIFQDFDLNDSILEKIPATQIINSDSISKNRDTLPQDSSQITSVISKPPNNILSENNKFPVLNSSIRRSDSLSPMSFQPKIQLEAPQPCWTAVTEDFDLHESTFGKIRDTPILNSDSILKTRYTSPKYSYVTPTAAKAKPSPDMFQDFDLNDSILQKIPATQIINLDSTSKTREIFTQDSTQITSVTAKPRHSVAQSDKTYDELSEKIKNPVLNSSIQKSDFLVPTNFQPKTQLEASRPRKTAIIEDFDLHESTFGKIRDTPILNSDSIPFSRGTFPKCYSHITPTITKSFNTTDQYYNVNNTSGKTKIPYPNASIWKPDIIGPVSKPLKTVGNEYLGLNDSVFEKLEVSNLKPSSKKSETISSINTFQLDGKLKPKPQDVHSFDLADSKFKNIEDSEKRTKYTSKTSLPPVCSYNMQQCTRVNYQPINNIERSHEPILDDPSLPTFNNILWPNNYNRKTNYIFAPSRPISTAFATGMPFPVPENRNIRGLTPTSRDNLRGNSASSYFSNTHVQNAAIKIKEEIMPNNSCISPIIKQTPFQLNQIITIEQFTKIKIHPEPARYSLKAKFKKLIEKFTIRNNEINLVIMVEDGTGEIPLKVHSEVICKLAKCTFSYLADYRKLYYKHDFEVFERLQNKVEELNAVMEIEIKDYGKTFILSKVYE